MYMIIMFRKRKSKCEEGKMIGKNEQIGSKQMSSHSPLTHACLLEFLLHFLQCGRLNGVRFLIFIQPSGSQIGKCGQDTVHGIWRAGWHLWHVGLQRWWQRWWYGKVWHCRIPWWWWWSGRDIRLWLVGRWVLGHGWKKTKKRFMALHWLKWNRLIS